MRHSRIEQRLFFSKMELIDNYCNCYGDQSPVAPRPINISHGLLSFGRISRKRTRSSLRIKNHPDEDYDGNANKNKYRKIVKARREPTELSFFDWLVDKALLLDGSSLDLFPVTIILLTIITTSILPNSVSQTLFVGPFLFFSSLALYPSLLPWSNKSGEIIKNSSASDNVDEEDSKFTMYYLSTLYIGALFFACVASPFDVAEAKDSSLLLITIIATILLGALSNSDLMTLLFEHKEVAGHDENDEDSLAISAEERLMDIWDQEFQRNESSGDYDN